jgi:choline dehydrogenase
MFDYIVVGAGSAGCVLANRLSHDRDARVLLLEAGGPDRKREIRIPAAFNKLFKTEIDWAYYTEPEPNLNGRRLFWPRGKVVGGSSSINAMIYIRGNRRDYDRWAELGCGGWDWASIHLYFERTLLNLSVTSLRTVNPMSKAFVDAAVRSGYPRSYDFNGHEQDGFGFYQVTQRKGSRHSAADAFLHAEKDRSNLTVITGALVSRIVIEGGRARGVRYRSGDRLEEATAEREVIVTAGTVNSPQLLMLSGIGPADHLRALGIEVVSDLPGVGENLQDHPCVAICYRAKEPVSLANAATPLNLARYLISRKGPLTSNVGECGGFVRTRSGLDRPDLQFHFAPAYFLDHGFRQVEGHGFSIGPTLVRPESRGRIRLRSSEPTDPPLIQANYLAAENDRRVLLEGIRTGRRIANAAPMDRYRGEEFCPGAKLESDGELLGFLRSSVETLYHPAGTCKMGVDELAVVDPRLRVRGVEGLRVADASVMPEVVTGNTNAPVMMLAEKAAAMILGESSSFSSKDEPEE